MSAEPVATEVATQVGRASDLLRAVLAPLGEMLRNQNEAMQQTIQPLTKCIERYLEATRDAPTVQAEVTKTLLAQGWFVTYGFTDRLFYALRELFESGNYEEADDIMAEFARSQEGDLEAALKVQFPKRTHIFADAFEAHRNGKYTLSIPVFLGQADGIGCEILGIPQQFFNTSERKNSLQKILEGIDFLGGPYTPTGEMKSMLDQLLEGFTIAEQTKKRDKWETDDPRRRSYNRHGVLHGYDTNYNTETNSLRCVLLLRYLIDVTQILHEDIPGESAEMNRM